MKTPIDISKRTKGDFKLHTDPLNRQWQVLSEDDFEICTIKNGWRAKQTNEANAAFIVKACNNFDAMKELLQDLKDGISDIHYLRKEAKQLLKSLEQDT